MKKSFVLDRLKGSVSPVLRSGTLDTWHIFLWLDCTESRIRQKRSPFLHENSVRKCWSCAFVLCIVLKPSVTLLMFGFWYIFYTHFSGRAMKKDIRKRPHFLVFILKYRRRIQESWIGFKNMEHVKPLRWYFVIWITDLITLTFLLCSIFLCNSVLLKM